MSIGFGLLDDDKDVEEALKFTEFLDRYYQQFIRIVQNTYKNMMETPTPIVPSGVESSVKK